MLPMALTGVDSVTINEMPREGLPKKKLVLVACLQVFRADMVALTEIGPDKLLNNSCNLRMFSSMRLTVYRIE
jgi:hypothetical protein